MCARAAALHGVRLQVVHLMGGAVHHRATRAGGGPEAWALKWVCACSAHPPLCLHMVLPEWTVCERRPAARASECSPGMCPQMQLRQQGRHSSTWNPPASCAILISAGLPAAAELPERDGPAGATARLLPTAGRGAGATATSGLAQVGRAVSRSVPASSRQAASVPRRAGWPPCTLIWLACVS